MTKHGHCNKRGRQNVAKNQVKDQACLGAPFAENVEIVTDNDKSQKLLEEI